MFVLDKNNHEETVRNLKFCGVYLQAYSPVLKVSSTSTLLKVTDIQNREVVLTVAAKYNNMSGEDYQGHTDSPAGEQLAPGKY